MEATKLASACSSRVGVLNHFGTVSAIVGVWFGVCAMFVFLALPFLYPNDRLSGFAMATKTCRAAKLPQAIKFVSVLK